MANTTTINEATRGTPDGTEYVRLATPGANWKAQLFRVTRIPLTTDTTFNVGYLTGTIAGGTSYTNGSYSNKPLNGGSGSGARADFLVSGGAIVMVRINDLTSAPANYLVNDVLTVLAADVGGTGSGFTFTITAVGNDTTGTGASATPFATPQAAWDYIQSHFNFAGFTATMQFTDNHYSSRSWVSANNSLLRITPWGGGGALIVKGNLNNLEQGAAVPSVWFDTSDNGSVNSTILVDEDVGGLSITWDRLQCNARNNFTNMQFDGGDNLVQNCAFGGGNPADPCMQAPSRGGNLEVGGTIWFLGNAPTTIINGGNFSIGFETHLTAGNGVTIAGNPNFGIGTGVGGSGPGYGETSSVFYDGLGSGTWSGGRSIDIGALGAFLDFWVSGFGSNLPIPGSAATIDSGGAYTQFNQGVLLASETGVGGAVDKNYGYFTPATGNTITMTVGMYNVIVDPSSNLAALTITMPDKITGTASKQDGMLMKFYFSKNVTTLTVNGSGGDTIVGAPAAITAGQSVSAIYKVSTTKWYFG